MKQIKRYNLISILLVLVSVGLLGMVSCALAAGDPAFIIINVQPSSTLSVDSALSQQPVLFIQDADNNPVSGVSVTAFKNSGTGVLRGVKTVVTDVNGLATFQGLGYSKTDAFTVAFISGDLSTVSNSVSLSAGAPGVSNSSISVSPSSTVADGKSSVAIVVNCKDKYGNIIPGAKVELASSGTGDTFVQSDIAGDPGKITVNLSSTKAESKVISVTVNGILVGKTDAINFVPGKIAKLSISADTPVTVSESSKIDITGLDQFDNTVANDSSSSISLSVDNGGSLSSALVVLKNGTASSSLTKTNPGSVNLTASSGSINVATQIVFTSSDSTVPTVLSQYPAGGALDVPANTIPHVDFSKAIDVTTLTTDNVQLRNSLDDSTVPVEVLAANGGKRVILQPILDLDFNTKYYLYVSADVGDIASNTLASSYNGGSFTTASDTKISSSVQDQSVGQDNQNTSTTSNKVTDAVTAVSNVPENKQNLPNVNSPNTTQNVTSGDVVDNSTASDAPISSNENATPSVPVKTPNASMDNYFQAGLMGVLKYIDINAFGNWFVFNFIWIISVVIVGFVVYIFWFIYGGNKEE